MLRKRNAPKTTGTTRKPRFDPERVRTIGCDYVWKKRRICARFCATPGGVEIKKYIVSGGLRRCAPATRRLPSVIPAGSRAEKHIDLPHSILMGSSFVCLYVHVVFATRDRKALLAGDWRAQLHRYMAGTLTGLEASAPSVGGTRDHVHLLFGMRAS